METIEVVPVLRGGAGCFLPERGGAAVWEERAFGGVCEYSSRLLEDLIVGRIRCLPAVELELAFLVVTKRTIQGKQIRATSYEQWIADTISPVWFRCRTVSRLGCCRGGSFHSVSSDSRR